MRRHAWLVLPLALAAGCGEDRLERDLHTLSNGEPTARRQAAQQLAGQHDPRIADAMVRALRDPDREVRCAAASALGGQEDRDAVVPLIALLESSLPGRECAIEPLARLHDERAVAPLLAQAARDGDNRAFEAVGAIGPGAITPLVSALRKETDPLRAESIARALVAAGGKQSLPTLLAMLTENDRLPRANAVLALGLMGDPQALDAITKAADSGIGTAPMALARLGQPGLEALLTRLQHASPHQRRFAADALAQSRDPHVVPLLERGLQSTDPVVVEGSARVLATLALLPTEGPDAPLQQAAQQALNAAWDRRDLHAIVGGVDYYLERPEDVEPMLEALAAHGDAHLAKAYADSEWPALHDAALKWQAAH